MLLVPFVMLLFLFFDGHILSDVTSFLVSASVMTFSVLVPVLVSVLVLLLAGTDSLLLRAPAPSSCDRDNMHMVPH